VLRRVLLALGVLFAALGVAVAAVPSLADVVRLPDVPRVVFAALAVVFALATHAVRKQADFRDPEAAAVRASGVEGRFEPPRPGAEIDAELDAGPRASTARSDERVRERLRILAVQVLSDAEGWSEAEARRRLDEGTWTDDETAAALFSERVSPEATDLVASFAGIESARRREVRHALAELERRSGVDAGGE